jgi:hypothetical protein
VTFDNEGSLLSQNGTCPQQVTNGPFQKAGFAGYTAESRVTCNLEHTVKSGRSESKTCLEPEYSDTSTTTSELTKHLETYVATSYNFHYLYAARLHLVCLAVLVRIMFLFNYDFMFGQVRYMYFSI